MKLSIILVHYGSKKILADCIKSIHASKPKTSYEVVVVDNNEDNRGYSQGNNLGVSMAKGEYVFILNPDTIIEKGTIDKLVGFLEKNKKVGIIAPMLTNAKGEVYPLQGTSKLTPWRGIFALSFLNKVFPNNPVSKKYWLKGADRSKPFEVDVAPGTAFMIKKSLFEKLGGFDENFFLYFEESDFCRRVAEARHKLFILPNAKVKHIWKGSTPKSPEIKKIFEKSRFYYFRKNFGLLNALAVEVFVRLNKRSLLLAAVLVLGTFLRFYKIQTNLIFNGEMGYDYMTIRSFVEAHQVPLIGPRTSHEWFFIGPLFYWLFGLLMPIFNYSVLVGTYFFAIIGVASIYVCYWTMKRLFNEKAGLISAFLLSFSPLWVQLAHDARFNGLTAMLFFPFYYYLVKSIRDKGKSLFAVGLILGVTFSFFPSPILLLPGSLVFIFLYRKRFDAKNYLRGILGAIIPVSPWLLYNMEHKFNLLSSIIIWIPYRVLGFLGYYPKNNATPSVLGDNFTGLYNFFQSTYLYKNNILIFALFATALIYILLKFKNNLALTVLVVISAVSYLGLFLHGNPPSHYYLVIYPVPIIFLALLLEWLSKKYVWIAILILVALFFFNMTYYFSPKWFYVDSTQMSKDMYYVPFSLQEKVTEFIANDAGTRSISLARVGPLDYFGENFSLNYQYLLWGLGKNPNDKFPLKYTIYEDTSNLPSNQRIYWVENIAITKNE